jgi:tetraprenyl-beta-curcumene synthase
MLREQALASIATKRFHCQGGASLAILAGKRWREAVRFIVALQTISDYLDNLSDRAGCTDGQALRHLHLAMLHAVDPTDCGAGCDYYLHYPAGDDGGYLQELVQTCSELVSHLGTPPPVLREGRRLAGLYSDLQVHKHIAPEGRVPHLEEWFADNHESNGLLWPEFAAASGSTLGVFATYCRAAAADLEPGGVIGLLDAYFPWICGLHILLDYLIDREEDEVGGDLNLTGYYRDDRERRERLLLFVRRAMAAASSLEHPCFHRTVVAGLLGVYLSDPKVETQGLGGLADELVAEAGRSAGAMRSLCVRLRRSGMV